MRRIVRKPERILRLADDRYIAALSAAVVSALGGKIGMTPRVYLKKLLGRSPRPYSNQFLTSIPVGIMH